MADFTPDAKLVQLAGGSVEQIHRVLETLESKLVANPEGVNDLVRPCGCCCRNSWKRKRGLRVCCRSCIALAGLRPSLRPGKQGKHTAADFTES